jgi:hypothetical protein
MTGECVGKLVANNEFPTIDLGGDDSSSSGEWGNPTVDVEPYWSTTYVPEGSLDPLVWKVVPSAFGAHFGVSAQGGFIGEAGTSTEWEILYNWRSNEFSTFKTTTVRPSIYMGTPQGIGVGIHLGTSSVTGLSENKYYGGYGRSTSVSGSIDGFGNFGVQKTSSVGLVTETDGLGDFFSPIAFDPNSGIPITANKTSVTFGLNAIPNALDVGMTNSYTHTEEFP